MKVLTDSDGNQVFCDAQTGEVLEEEDSVPMLVNRRHKVWDRERWTVVFHEGLEATISMSLAPSVSQVLHGIIPRMEFDNWLILNQGRFAADLSIQRSTVNRAIGTLRDRGIVIDATDDPTVPEEFPRGQLLIHRVNPFIWWRGRRVDVSKARDWWRRRTR